MIYFLSGCVDNFGGIENKLIFASVHDSYWTHAADIDAMSEIIRETFVSLHQLPILEELLKEVHCTLLDFFYLGNSYFRSFCNNITITKFLS